MRDAGEAGTEPGAHGGHHQRRRPPPAVPDDTFDRIIASEVLEHVSDDQVALDEIFRVLKPGGTLAATVPSWLPEQICWALSRRVPRPLRGGRPRPHLHRAAPPRPGCATPGLKPGFAHHAHALHSPYWWLKCAVGPTNDDHPLVKAYLQVLIWDIAQTQPMGTVTRWTERLLNPVLGKSLVVYASKPGGKA